MNSLPYLIGFNVWRLGMYIKTDFGCYQINFDDDKILNNNTSISVYFSVNKEEIGITTNLNKDKTIIKWPENMEIPDLFTNEVSFNGDYHYILHTMPCDSAYFTIEKRENGLITGFEYGQNVAETLKWKESNRRQTI